MRGHSGWANVFSEEELSLHILTTTTDDGKHVTVTMGYDPLLDYVFCTVKADNGDVLYSNLRDPNAGTHQKNVVYYRHVLKDQRINAPDSMFKEVEEDQSHRVGNRVVVHSDQR
jgi:hypothetical protein